MKPIEFYFDFSSPYGYLASTQIDTIAAAHGREVDWRPFLVGTAMKRTGHAPLFNTPMFHEYVSCDVPRFARLLNVPFKLPDPFPVATVAACRAYYWQRHRNPVLAREFAGHLLRAYFSEGRNISRAGEVEKVAGECGADVDALSGALKSPEVKEAFRSANDAALAKGVFGSPFILVDDQPFWGADRLHQVEAWLKTGGW